MLSYERQMSSLVIILYSVNASMVCSVPSQNFLELFHFAFLIALYYVFGPMPVFSLFRLIEEFLDHLPYSGEVPVLPGFVS